MVFPVKGLNKKDMDHYSKKAFKRGIGVLFPPMLLPNKGLDKKIGTPKKQGCF